MRPDQTEFMSACIWDHNLSEFDIFARYGSFIKQTYDMCNIFESNIKQTNEEFGILAYSRVDVTLLKTCILMWAYCISLGQIIRTHFNTLMKYSLIN